MMLKGSPMRKSIGTILAISLTLAAGAAGAAAVDHQYVGAKKCRTCHKKELIGNQYGEWQKGKHAQAFESLKSEKALEFAKKKGLSGPPHEADECLKCHVTAHGEDPALLKTPLAPSDGIQCESCHGPGSGYRKKKIMSDHDKAVAAGMWEPGKDEKICTRCHNDESPAWDAAKGFDYEEAKKAIAHPIPEDVKGKYLEAEKKLRAEKGEAEEVDEEEEE